MFHFYERSLNWYGYFICGLQVDHTARRASDLGVSGLPGLPLLPWLTALCSAWSVGRAVVKTVGSVWASLCKAHLFFNCCSVLLFSLVFWAYIQTKGNKEILQAYIFLSLPFFQYCTTTSFLLFHFFKFVVYLVLSFTFSDSRQEDWLGKAPNYQKCLPLPCFRCKVCWKGLCFCGYIFDFLKIELPCCCSYFGSSAKDSKIESHTHACMHAHTKTHTHTHTHTAKWSDYFCCEMLFECN